MYKVNRHQTPRYISDLVSTVAAAVTRPGSAVCALGNYQLTTVYRGSDHVRRALEGAFSYSGPAAWNKLPHDIRASHALDVFKRKLKTYCFKEAFSFSYF